MRYDSSMGTLCKGLGATLNGIDDNLTIMTEYTLLSGL